MNGPNEPLTADALDELLSADIDGELDHAAADLGLTPEAARSAMTTPAAVARRAALTRASELVGSDVPLPSGDADRLVARALTDATQADELTAARRRRRRAETARRVLVAAGSAAAVIVVIVALASMRPSSEGSKSSALSTAGRADSAPPKGARGKVAFGDVTDPRALRARVRANLPASPEFSTGSSGTTAPGPTRSADRVAGPSTDSQQNTKARPDCLAQLRRRTGIRSRAVLSGNGVAHGRPVSVVVFQRGAAYDVFVLGANDCAVVSRTRVS